MRQGVWGDPQIPRPSPLCSPHYLGAPCPNPSSHHWSVPITTTSHGGAPGDSWFWGASHPARLEHPWA